MNSKNKKYTTMLGIITLLVGLFIGILLTNISITGHAFGTLMSPTIKPSSSFDTLPSEGVLTSEIIFEVPEFEDPEHGLIKSYIIEMNLNEQIIRWFVAYTQDKVIFAEPCFLNGEGTCGGDAEELRSDGAGSDGPDWAPWYHDNTGGIHINGKTTKRPIQ